MKEEQFIFDYTLSEFDKFGCILRRRAMPCANDCGLSALLSCPLVTRNL